MSVLEQKGEIHQWISDTHDALTLAKIRAALGRILKKKETEQDWWDELSPEQQAEIDEALCELDDDSKWVPHEEVMELFAKYR